MTGNDMEHSHDKYRADTILAIDAGTQSIRAALVDLAGNIVAIVKTPMRRCSSPEPGMAEHDPEYFWQMLCETCRELFAKTARAKERLLGVALTTQRGTVIDVDKHGKPLRPAIVWLDERKANAAKHIPPHLVFILKSFGLHDFFEGVVRDCEINWIRQHQPDIWTKTHKHLYLSGWLTYKLTGEYRDSSGNIVGYVPFNTRKGAWAGKHDIKQRLFPIEREKLPELLRPSEILGYVTETASSFSGIPKGIPVVAAANDKACEILGAGAVSPETACISFGTISTINTQCEKYVELRPFWPSFPAAVPGHFYTEVAVLRGAWMITWFKEEFGLQERLEAAEKGVSAEELLDILIRDIPPASLGLVLQPYWTPGPEMAKCARGSIIGFCDMHKRSHVYKAVLEGLVYALKEGAQLTERKTRAKIGNLRVSGGGSQSDSVMQICADIFNLPAQRPHSHETSILGAAIDGAVGLELHEDFPTAIREMTRAGDTFEPLAANSLIYADIYERVYLKMFKRLMPLFRELQAITGYPPPVA